MGKLMMAVLSVLCLGVLGLAIAQQQQQPPPPPQQAAPETAEKSQKAAKSFAGEVVSIDVTNKDLVVKDAAGAETHVAIDTSTKIKQGDKTLTMSDLKAGDRVTYECEEATGPCKAKTIKITPPPHG